jgi:hypothetical protein
MRFTASRLRLGAVVLALAMAGVLALPAAASAQGRTIDSAFCLNEHLFCLSAGLDGQTPVEGYGVSNGAGTCAPPPATTDPPAGPGYCVPSGTGLLTLRPGTYWISVLDDQAKHNFALRSCPWSTSPCTDTNPATTTETAITGIPEVDSQPVTIKVHLQPGWYRLFCQADAPVDHENAGMYIDIEVGGVGQFG